MVEAGEVIAMVDGVPVKAQIKGIIRGMLRDGTSVWKGMKAGDIDPRGEKEFWYLLFKAQKGSGMMPNIYVSDFSIRTIAGTK